MGGDPPPRARAAELRLGHLRRGWHDPGPHGPGDRAHCPRDHADPAGAPDVRERVGGAAAPGRRAVCRRGSAQHPRPAR